MRYRAIALVVLATGLAVGVGISRHDAGSAATDRLGTTAITGVGLPGLPALDAAPRGRDQLDRETETRRADLLAIIGGGAMLVLAAWWVVRSQRAAGRRSLARTATRPRAPPLIPALVRAY